MSKTVSYTSEKWGGSVTFYDPLTLEQEAAWEYALGAFNKAREANGGVSAFLIALVPGFTACVEKWELKDFPERITLDTWPRKQKMESAKLIGWLVTNISELYSDSVTIPNV